MLSPQAGIPAPTLTVMQGFEANKDSFVHLLPSSYILYHICTTHPRIESGCVGLRAEYHNHYTASLQQCNDKMSYLNQMYENKAMARAWAFAWLASTYEYGMEWSKKIKNLQDFKIILEQINVLAKKNKIRIRLYIKNSNPVWLCKNIAGLCLCSGSGSVPISDLNYSIFKLTASYIYVCRQFNVHRNFAPRRLKQLHHVD